MKKLIIAMTFIGSIAQATEDITVTVDWVQNVAKNAVLEVCGKAVSKSGKWPLVVSINHGESTFTTLTNKEGKYCQLLGRQTFKGEVEATAVPLGSQ